MIFFVCFKINFHKYSVNKLDVLSPQVDRRRLKFPAYMFPGCK